MSHLPEATEAGGFLGLSPPHRIRVPQLVYHRILMRTSGSVSSRTCRCLRLELYIASSVNGSKSIMSLFSFFRRKDRRPFREQRRDEKRLRRIVVIEAQQPKVRMARGRNTDIGLPDAFGFRLSSEIAEAGATAPRFGALLGRCGFTRTAGASGLLLDCDFSDSIPCELDESIER